MERIPLDYAIWLVGRELQFCSGIRALAAEKIMAEQALSDAVTLFDSCEKLIGTANLFEAFDHPQNPYPADFVLGKGAPRMEVYLVLREQFGELWVATTVAEHLRRWGTPVDLGTTELAQVVQKLVMRAHICFEYDKVWWDVPATPDGFDRYDRLNRIESLNGWLSDCTFKRAA
ncbi:hypothetical protein [Stutzerimonas nitrititolerans]|uniref:hypothetical protein n=1 Tax=Stutzerimonas nitrititolerans TaxID=2482751 RepID=UPI0028ADCC8E|nr:hypothetical protein [Stutzerimonas nitrititolerans]